MLIHFAVCIACSVLNNNSKKLHFNGLNPLHLWNMRKHTRLLLTLWLILLTALMPPMAFACASVCAVGCEQMTMETGQQDAMAEDMSHCHHASAAVVQADPSHPSTADKATPCLANIICHLTVGINTSPIPAKTFATYSAVVPHAPAFVPQVALSPPDKPPRV